MVEVLAPEELVDDWNDLSTSDLAPGTRLGRYELLLPIAYGGMARVWAARQHGQRGFSKLVAIKTILPHLARDPEFERMFLDEARIASGVHHPNVCEIYELGEEGHALYLAMEWVHGESFVHVLRPNRKTTVPIDARVAARIVADACSGLHAAHNLTDDHGEPLHVVHRDVSPHNVLVSIDGNVKVADFGVAKAYGQMHDATVAGQLKGKVAYMAPEQITGGAVDRRSDLYSLGCILYEATTGTLPFRGENDAQVMQAVFRGEYAPPSRVVQGYPAALERIIVRALSQDPTKRFPTAESLRLALEDWIVRSGPVMAASHVGTVVRQRCGVEIEKRRERLRAAMQSTADASGGYAQPALEHTPSQQGMRVQQGSHSGVKAAAVVAAMRPRMPSRPEPSVVVSEPPPANAAPAVAPAATPPPPIVGRVSAANITASSERTIRSGRGVLIAAIAGGALLATIGVGSLVVWKMSSRAPAASRAVPAKSAPAPTTSAVASASAAPPVVSSTAPVAMITFKVVPDSAILIVDGAELEAGARAIPRPPPGKVVSVTIRAAGHQDEPLKIDDSVPTTVDIWLQPVGASAPQKPSMPTGPGSPVPGGAMPGGPVAPVRGGPAPAPPPNPYGK
jgi:serine/threonine-protein kinase